MAQTENALVQKLLVLEEAAGAGGAMYSLRALQSGELRVAATGKDPITSKMRTEEYVVKTRTSVMMTSTNPNFDEETKSRFIQTTVDESAEMTQRILEVQRQAETMEGLALARRADKLQKLHQNAQRFLKDITVANPYAEKLVFPSQSLLARRDHKKYLGLIKASALLHQYQRERVQKTIYGETMDCIEVKFEDIALANRIAKQVLVTRHKDTMPHAKLLLSLTRNMFMNGHGKSKGEAVFNRRQLREHTGWGDWQIRTHLQELVDLEYIHVRQGKFGKEYVYELSDVQLLSELPGFGLTDVEELREVFSQAVKPNLVNLEVKIPNIEAP